MGSENNPWAGIEDPVKTEKVEKPVNPATLPDVYVNCPYFPEHELRRSRLPYHLLKCQKNPRAPKLWACPFNYLHRIRSEDRADHLNTCEDRPKTKYNDKVAPSFNNTINAILGSRRLHNGSIPEERYEAEVGRVWWGEK